MQMYAIQMIVANWLNVTHPKHLGIRRKKVKVIYKLL